MSSSDRVGSGFVPGIAIPTVLIICALAALLLAGCSAPWGSASPPAPTPSPTPSPVQLTLALTQVGKVGDGSFDLIATVTVTNHLTEPIALTSPYSFYAPVRLDLFVPPSTQRFSAYPLVVTHCPVCNISDLETITAGRSRVWALPVYRSEVPANDFVPGATWRMVAHVFWHTGPLASPDGEGTNLIEASGEAQITLT
jgi:hypothetical protein